jgi:hypothetical protein
MFQTPACSAKRDHGKIIVLFARGFAFLSGLLAENLG